MDIKNIIIKSYKKAYDASNGAKPQIIASTEGDRNRQRSKNFVEMLAENFDNEYKRYKKHKSEKIIVFSRGCRKNRCSFGLNELLHDIAVCSVSKSKAPKQKKVKLSYITRVYWQVESEFARDSKQAIIDFNKLVLGSADNKLFVGSLVKNNSKAKDSVMCKKFMKTLAKPAGACRGNIYAAFLPHPSEWKADSAPIVCQFIGNQFVEI
ncbi:MAG: hypothetical protein QY316_11330 [Thermodesulfobacteriota bacterium]|nr:MAG: hypothetical protein QY316_11330 [Thermodesulfobacteriota bacterium]